MGRIVRQISVLPGFAMCDSFGSLLEYLVEELGYEPAADLLEFPYDWRQDNADSAEQLASAIRDWRSSRPQPTEKVTLIAHSMGGLVARAYLSSHRGTDAVERCIFVGTPHLGSLKPLRMAVAGIRLLPFGVALQKIRKLILGCPAFYQLLPTDASAVLENGRPFMPLRDDPNWLDSSHRQHIETAAEFRKCIDAADEHSAIPTTCIYGYGQNTLQRIVLSRERSGRLSLLEEQSLPHGDGIVIEKSAVLPSSAIHPVMQRHESLHSDPNVMRQLRFELLERPR